MSATPAPVSRHNDLIWAGRLESPVLGAVNGWNCDVSSLLQLLDETARLVVLEPLSFPWEVLGEQHRDIPVELHLPTELDAPAIGLALGKVVLMHLTALDAVVESRSGVRQALEQSWPQLKHCWRDVGSGHSFVATEVVETELGQFEAFNDDLITGHLREFGAHQRGLLQVVLDLLEDCTTFIDVGSHIGTITIPAAHRHPQLQVVAIEGNPSTYALLAGNVERNGLTDRVRTERAVVAAKAGNSVPVTKPGNTGATEFVSEGHPRRHPRMVPSRALDELLDPGEHEDRKTLVKIDVEGAELEALQGGAAFIDQVRPTLVLEVPGELGPETREHRRKLAMWLETHKYDVALIKGPRQSTTSVVSLAPVTGIAEWPTEMFDLVAQPREIDQTRVQGTRARG